MPGPPPLPERLLLRLGAVTPTGWQVVDVVVAGVAFVGLTLPALLGYPSSDGAPAAVVLFGAATTLPIAVRRRWPLGVLVVVTAAAAIGTIAGVRFTPFASNAGPAVGLAMYVVAERLPRRTSLTALAATFLVSWISPAVAMAAHPQQDHNAVHAIAALVGWFAGDAVRSRRTYRAELAAHRRDEADARAQQGIAEERLRISREVHDVVSHNLSVIAVQSGMGRLVFDTQPEEARAALQQVERLSRGALDELRRILDTTVRRTDSPLAPAPGLGDLPELVEHLTAGGVPVTLEIEGPRAKLPPMLELSAYRIVQEALTNVLKHAPGASARVKVRYGSGDLVVEVIDDGVPDAPIAAGAGWGIAGMSERAALFGGSVVAGPVATGGFHVAARLPTPTPAPAPETHEAPTPAPEAPTWR